MLFDALSSCCVFDSGPCSGIEVEWGRPGCFVFWRPEAGMAPDWWSSLEVLRKCVMLRSSLLASMQMKDSWLRGLVRARSDAGLAGSRMNGFDLGTGAWRRVVCLDWCLIAEESTSCWVVLADCCDQKAGLWLFGPYRKRYWSSGSLVGVCGLLWKSVTSQVSMMPFKVAAFCPDLH